MSHPVPDPRNSARGDLDAAVSAAGRGDRDFAQAFGTLAGEYRRFALRAGQHRIHRLDNEEEDGRSNQHEIDQRGDERAVPNLGVSYRDGQV